MKLLNLNIAVAAPAFTSKAATPVRKAAGEVLKRMGIRVDTPVMKGGVAVYGIKSKERYSTIKTMVKELQKELGAQRFDVAYTPKTEAVWVSIAYNGVTLLQMEFFPNWGIVVAYSSLVIMGDGTKFVDLKPRETA